MKDVSETFALPLASACIYKKQENRKLGPDGRVLYVPVNGSLSRSPFSGPPWELPTTAGDEMWGSVSLLLLFIFFNIVACVNFQLKFLVKTSSETFQRIVLNMLLSIHLYLRFWLNNNKQNTIFLIRHFYIGWPGLFQRFLLFFLRSPLVNLYQGLWKQ